MFELQTLGGLDLRTGSGEPVEALERRTKCLALLAYLAIEAPDGHLPRETVAALLWSEGTDPQARAALRTTLSHIRRATDADLVSGGGTSRLGLAGGQVRADVAAFREALEAGEEAEALELYRGDFLAGIRVEDAPLFERWVDERRERFRDEAHEAALSIGRAARRGGDLEAAQAAFQRALDLRPLREPGALGLVRTLAERGRAAEAVQRFEDYRARRQEELQLPPSEELATLVDRIRAGDIERAAESREEEPAESPAPAEGPVESPRVASTSGSSAWRRPGPMAAAALVLVAAAFGLWRILGTRGDAAATAGDRSVAVLPFDATGTEDPGPIAAGLHSDLLTRLSAVGDLEVISATSVERFRDADVPLPAVADSLGVEWVLEGQIQRAGEEIEVHAQLIDPRTDTHAWANTYRRELTAENLFDLQSDISRRIAGVLETRLTAGEEDRLDRRATRSLQAHRFYVRGRSLLEQWTEPEIRRALEYFEQALAEDSSYALAWAGKADALTQLVDTPRFSVDSTLTEAFRAARRALTLAPDLAEAHGALGHVHIFRREGPAALRALQRAVELRPSFATAYSWLSKTQLVLGRPEEALASAERAVQLDPLPPLNRVVLFWASLATGDVERALSEGRRIRRERPEVAPNQLPERITLFHLRRATELKALARENQGSTSRDSLFLALIAAESGNRGPAEKLLTRAGEMHPMSVVLLNAALGRDDETYDALREAVLGASPRLTSSVSARFFWPELLGPYRDDPRYEKLIRDLNDDWGLNPDGSLPESTRG